MAEEVTDFWGDITTNVLSPIAILRHQAGQLRHRTKGLLEADVKTELDAGVATHKFVIVAPALDRYALSLFEAYHSEALVYPVRVKFKPWDDQAATDYTKAYDEFKYGKSLIELHRTKPPDRKSGLRSASTQEEFFELLRLVLTSGYTKSVITSLLAKINDAAPKDQDNSTLDSPPSTGPLGPSSR